MPEIVEVEKLRRQITPAWVGRKITSWRAPKTSPNPTKYFQGEWDDFVSGSKRQPISGTERVGKHLLVGFSYCNFVWHIHLNSTGWWMPGNPLAAEEADLDPIYGNFLHSINAANIRLKMEFDDGQKWHYHDPRTWGKWWIRNGRCSTDIDYFYTNCGPDWLNRPRLAKQRLFLIQSQRTVKDVLCDQSIASGLGNYLVCEILHRARVHPHTSWATIHDSTKERICDHILPFIEECFESYDHSHWNVFDRASLPCRVCDYPIQYAKDGSGKRGSYFCENCQGTPVT